MTTKRLMLTVIGCVLMVVAAGVGIVAYFALLFVVGFGHLTPAQLAFFLPTFLAIILLVWAGVYLAPTTRPYVGLLLIMASVYPQNP